MYQDYKDVLSAFQSRGVKYLVVGGFAVIYHSQPRFTKDMDLFIKADLENANAIYAALSDFGAPLQDIRPEDFTDRNTFFRFGRDPKGFDILPSIPGVDFDAAWQRRVETVIDTATGLNARSSLRSDAQLKGRHNLPSVLGLKLGGGRTATACPDKATKVSGASRLLHGL